MFDDLTIFFNEFAEVLVYKAINETQHYVKAIVIRDAPQSDGETSHISKQAFEVIIPESVNQGRQLISVGKDKISLPLYEGGNAIDFTVSEIIKKQNSHWHIRVTR